MSIQEIIHPIAHLLNPAPALDERELVTLYSRVVITSGDSTIDGYVVEWGEPDSWGTEYFRVLGVRSSKRTAQLSWTAEWATHAQIIEVVGL